MGDPMDRRRADDERFANIEKRLTEGAHRMVRLEKGLAENTALTAEIRDLIATARAGLKVLGGLGAIAKWVGVVAAAAAAIKAAMHSFWPGK